MRAQGKPIENRSGQQLTWCLRPLPDSLYNPNYGYFSKQVVIFTPGEPFNFNSLYDELDFHSLLSKRYVEFEDSLDAISPSDTRQLWYTPTELFRPYYGEAIARYLVANYKLTASPYHDLIIYEMGAGRGTLMLNILDYIRAVDPAVYNRTKYKIIEISTQLATLQSSQLMQSFAARGHADKVEIINQSIFDWTNPVPSPCFFLAFEVFDNFAHDVLRYDMETHEPLQRMVRIDDAGDFYEFYTRQLDPVAARYVRVRDAATGGQHKVPYPTSRIGRWLAAQKPLAANLSAPEYIPTRLMEFFDVLGRYFPAHRLLTSDFHSLPDATKGLNAPIVQTRFQRRPVPVSTPLVSSPTRNISPGACMTDTVSAGPPGLLRHHVPDQLPNRRSHLPGHHGQADARAHPRGVYATVGVRRGHRDAERRESSLDMVQECQCATHCITCSNVYTDTICTCNNTAPDLPVQTVGYGSCLMTLML
jgi:hypothetical protein